MELRREGFNSLMNSAARGIEVSNANMDLMGCVDASVSDECNRLQLSIYDVTSCYAIGHHTSTITSTHHRSLPSYNLIHCHRPPPSSHQLCE
ncbi:hypothetical protein O6P43_032200 [Quillaja saponaria]|uniref:Uncharacterized protein n=1 Tax=Quillaja saponaria TaxID=32244 RepID=A0AAD7KX34_QUISA|nr:hypothetical protein O6P43_032200 [Quillaja saponaria]